MLQYGNMQDPIILLLIFAAAVSWGLIPPICPWHSSSPPMHASGVQQPLILLPTDFDRSRGWYPVTAGQGRMD